MKKYGKQLQEEEQKKKKERFSVVEKFVHKNSSAKLSPEETGKIQQSPLLME